jgi:hypothetical protein
MVEESMKHFAGHPDGIVDTLARRGVIQQLLPSAEVLAATKASTQSPNSPFACCIHPCLTDPPGDRS